MLDAVTQRHLDPACPLRHDGRLGAVTVAEFAMQAVALHGALTDGKEVPPAISLPCAQWICAATVWMIPAWARCVFA